jgi:hypothetical protein
VLDFIPSVNPLYTLYCGEGLDVIKESGGARAPLFSVLSERFQSPLLKNI